jgi:hypothetical protein
MPGALGQRLAVGGEHETPSGALDQPAVELGLQGGDAATHRGLAEPQPARRGGQAAGLRHGQEDAQGIPVHSFTPE